MNTTAEVYIWGSRIGIIHQDINKCSFLVLLPIIYNTIHDYGILLSCHRLFQKGESFESNECQCLQY